MKPQDFTAARWTRGNHEELRKVAELDVEELREGVDDFGETFDGQKDDVDSLESQMSRLERRSTVP